MSKLSTEELDLQIQLTLVARIRHAAHLYRIAPAEAGSAAFQSYVAALECLAEHIAAKCRGARVSLETAVPAHRLGAAHHPSGPGKPGTERRVIAFPSANGSSPQTAA
jgi:hypothetical protein